MKTYTFNSQMRLGAILPSFATEVVKDEPMFFSCSRGFAYEKGGPITRAFIDAIELGWDDCIIDSRVHMLMPNWYPAIPGYHHDDVPRSTLTGQPNYETPEYYAEHVMSLVNGDVCPTDFAIGTATFDEVNGRKTYDGWNEAVNNHINEGNLTKVAAPSNQMIYFDWQTWHTGTKAAKNGWRWFARASRNTKRPIKNEIRRQVQVYLEKPMEGW